ncbi:MAG TPA: hypothetical protein P5234_03570 [Thermoanaerobaculaceae bacterium]|nr:hypothetical protein [Thermoanaerobaculaceae bacterium]HRS15311.1 hypothetical protein [Thermoanaerobaculaceae bacterium]
MNRVHWPRPGHLLLVLPLVAVAVWVGSRGGRVRDDPAHVLAALRMAAGPMLPGEGAVGAASRTALESYDPQTLYEFIDGAAESYLGNGFERCVAVVYTFRAGGTEHEVAAEVYRFVADSGARAQLAAERPAEASEIEGLPGAVADATTLLAVKGRDYLKLTAMAAGPGVDATLRAIAAVWLAGET